MITLLVKTHFADLLRVNNLLDSLVCSQTMLPICVIGDKAIILRLKKFSEKISNLKLIDEREILSKREQELPGYISQQIVKLRFHETCETDNYFCMDSDGLVLRKLVVSDFLGTDNFIKDFVVDNNSIELNKYWIQRYSCKRKQYLSDIEAFFRIKKFVTAHGFVSLSVEIMKEFDKFLIDKKLDYSDILNLSPMEFSWYYGFIQYKGISIRPAINPFHTFHVPSDYEAYLQPVINKEINLKYKGIVLNSNWADYYNVFKNNQKLPLKYHLRKWLGKL